MKNFDWKLWGLIALSTISAAGCWASLISGPERYAKRRCDAIAKHSRNVEVFYDKDVGCMQRLPNGSVEIIE